LKTLFLALTILSLSLTASASQSSNSKQQINLEKDFDSLGNNQAVIQRAKALDPKNKTKVVQSRVVDMYNRLEIGGNIGGVMGGDSYYSTTSLGANLDFHFNPHWSLGARYYHNFNSLTSEGNAAFNQAAQDKTTSGIYHTPALDYPIDTTLGVVSWYPIYGKLNLFDMGVSHFDIYLLGGGGVTSLASGSAPTVTAGGGFAFWWTNWLASRLEVRYQEYTEHPYYDSPQSSSQQVNDVVGMLSLGILL
jgi:outer membrane immunogenic protein